MGVVGRKRAAAAVAVVALAIVAVVSTGGSASGSPPVVVLPPFPGDVGVLRLHMGGTSDYFRFDPSDGAGGYTAGTAEPLTVANGCELAAQPTSVTLTPTPNGGSAQGKVGLVGHSLGVKVKGEGSGTPCGQVNGTSQALTLSLAGSVASKSMDYAELDVEGKFGVTIRADLYLNGTLVRTETMPTNGAADSGPDSGFADNVRWRVPATSAGLVVFDEIKLSVNSTTPTGAFSLEGGGDGTPALPAPSLGATLGTTDSLFHVTNIEGMLGCGGTVTSGGTNGLPSASITSSNVGGCVPVPYSLTPINDGSQQAVVFQKPNAANNTYLATFVWPVEASAMPVPATLIDYGSGPQTLQWCNGTYNVPLLPAGQSWCLRSHDAKLDSTGKMQVTEEMFGKADPVWQR